MPRPLFLTPRRTVCLSPPLRLPRDNAIVSAPDVLSPPLPLQLPRAKAIVSAPDVLSPSGPDEAEEFCRVVLGVELSSGLLESWVENLREWLARQVRAGWRT